MSVEHVEERVPAQETPGVPLLELSNVSKHFGGLAAVQNVDLRIMPGEIISIIGPNGAGKTTVFNLITGIYKVSSEANNVSGSTKKSCLSSHYNLPRQLMFPQSKPSPKLPCRITYKHNF